MTFTPLPVESPPKSISIEPYLKQNGQWPSSGPVILAQYDDDTMVVYVETSKVVAAHAVEMQQGFRAGFEPIRVYTSFIRSQAHTEWNTKFDAPDKLHYQQKLLRIRQRLAEQPAYYTRRNISRKYMKEVQEVDPITGKFDYPQQRHTLAIRIRRSTFDKWIETATAPDGDVFDDGDDFHNTQNYNGWRYGQVYWQPWASIHYDGVVYRWVNDIYPVLPLNGTASHQRLARKALELFLYNDAANKFTSTVETLSVEDITPFVDEMRTRLTNNKKGNLKDIWSPSERPYIPSTDRILD